MEESIICRNDGCLKKFPVINGVPVLLNESNSIFSIDDFISFKTTTFNLKKSNIRNVLHKINKSTGFNAKAEKNLKKIKKLLLEKNTRPKVLVVGGSIEGDGMAVMREGVELIGSDVTFGPLTSLISDAHNIPFEENTFDGVIVQSVLEHVVDPYRCVEEIYRVLKLGGIVYSETPFMQQVHMGRYDFTRFTHLGHRRLFRKFDEIDSGACCGSGMALSWAYRGFLRSFSSSRKSRVILGVVAASSSFFLKYCDYFTINTSSTLDSASAFYFIGSKSMKILSDKDLVSQYKGAQQ